MSVSSRTERMGASVVIGLACFLWAESWFWVSGRQRSTSTALSATSHSEVAAIEKERLSIDKEQLALSYAPSVDVIYSDHRLNIFNRGKTNLYVAGSAYGDLGSLSMDAIIDVPRTVSPGGFYYLLADQLETTIHERLGPNGEVRLPYYVFLATEDKQKLRFNCQLWIVVKNGEITIHTQGLGFTKVDWNDKAVTKP